MKLDIEWNPAVRDALAAQTEALMARAGEK